MVKKYFQVSQKNINSKQMTPTEAITKISHAIAKGKLEDAEKALEGYAKQRHFEFKKWVDKIVISGKANYYGGFNDNQLWDIFTNQSK